MWETQARLGNLYASDKRDWNAIRSTALQLFELQRLQHESAIELQQKIDGLLTDAQRQELAQPQRGYGWKGRQ
jgi:Spy/CpxP family protein refolding chaperone